jgi:hypothetical protein
MRVNRDCLMSHAIANAIISNKNILQTLFGAYCLNR